jgi:hypothetical protein
MYLILADFFLEKINQSLASWPPMGPGRRRRAVAVDYAGNLRGEKLPLTGSSEVRTKKPKTVEGRVFSPTS